MAGVLGLRPEIIKANEPVARVGGACLKPALNVFSFSRLLDAEIKKPGTGVTLLQVLDFCARQGIEGLDVTSYYFPEYPNVPPETYLYEFKRRAFELGIDVFGVGARNYFITGDKALRAKGIENVKRWVEVAARLGARVVRVFADDLVRRESWAKALPGYTHQQVETWVADDLRACAEHGRQHGIIIGVQNHGDFNGVAKDFLRLIKLVDSEWCAPVIDTSYFNTPDPYVDIAQVAPYAVNWIIKQSAFDGGYGEVPIDLRRLLRIGRSSGYRGYLTIETLFAPERPAEPFTAVPALLKKLRAAIAATG
jgi:sugar phosphate isomerase/epimerase